MRYVVWKCGNSYLYHKKIKHISARIHARLYDENSNTNTGTCGSDLSDCCQCRQPHLVRPNAPGWTLTDVCIFPPHFLFNKSDIHTSDMYQYICHLYLAIHILLHTLTRAIMNTYVTLEPQGITGENYTLREFQEQGKPVVLEFIAHWCPFSWDFSENGLLSSFSKRYGPNGMWCSSVEFDDIARM